MAGRTGYAEALTDYLELRHYGYGHHNGLMYDLTLFELRWLATEQQARLTDLLDPLPEPSEPEPWATFTADHLPVDDLSPTVAHVRAHAVLTAAPPVSRFVPAGVPAL